MKIEKDEFLEFLAEALMYNDEPLEFDTAMPPLVFDSTGKLMFAAAYEDKYGKIISLDDLAQCEKPREVYELICKQD